jgi:hypothetical protein
MVRPRNPNLFRPGWQLEWAPTGPEQPICGVRWGSSKHVVCEMPPDHRVTREGVPYTTASHMGRSRIGRWYTWRTDYGQ